MSIWPHRNKPGRGRSFQLGHFLPSCYSQYIRPAIQHNEGGPWPALRTFCPSDRGCLTSQLAAVVASIRGEAPLASDPDPPQDCRPPAVTTSVTAGPPIRVSSGPTPAAPGLPAWACPGPSSVASGSRAQGVLSRFRSGRPGGI